MSIWLRGDELSFAKIETIKAWAAPGPDFDDPPAWCVRIEGGGTVLLMSPSEAIYTAAKIMECGLPEIAEKVVEEAYTVVLQANTAGTC